MTFVFIHHKKREWPKCVGRGGGLQWAVACAA